MVLPPTEAACAKPLVAALAAVGCTAKRTGGSDASGTANAEKELRAFVLWRKRSFGTQSHRGNILAENLMTIAYTARKQQRNVLTYLTACCALPPAARGSDDAASEPR